MKKEHDLKRLTRIVRLLNILSDGSLVIADVAKDLDVSVRTIQRDIRTIEDAGFPLFNEKPGQLRFYDGFSLKKVHLSNEEASMLVLMADIIKPLGTRFDNSFQSLKSKIFNADADSLFYIKMPKGLKYEENATTKVLEKGIENKTWVNMTLAHDPAKKLMYEVRPLKLLNYEGFWYLMGVNRYEKLKKFRLDRILEAKNTTKPFKIGKNFQKVLDQSTNIWFQEKRDKKIVVKVAPAIAPYFKTKQILPLQKIVKEDKKGNLTIESMVSQNVEAIRILQQWIPGVTIVSPKDLKEEMRGLFMDALHKI